MKQRRVFGKNPVALATEAARAAGAARAVGAAPATIYKMQGAQLPHVTIWLDRPGMKAAAYVAMSRVRRDNEYLLGGIVTQAHVVPNA